MYIHDSHIHTKFSYDCKSEINDIAEAAIARGISEISLCDHYDIDKDRDTVYRKLDIDGAKRAILEAKEKYTGRLQINYGIEIGGAHACPDIAKATIDKMGFEFIIGSLHNLENYPNYAFINFERINASSMSNSIISHIMRRTIEETEKVVDFGGFSTLGHITFFERYLRIGGIDFDIKPYLNDFERILKKLISKGIALEINTKGLRLENAAAPKYEIESLYRELGGELITLGSDAHVADQVGLEIENTAAALRSLGFKSQCVVRDGRLTQIEL